MTKAGKAPSPRLTWSNFSPFSGCPQPWGDPTAVSVQRNSRRTFELLVPLLCPHGQLLGGGVVRGLHFVREVMQVAGEFLHLLNDTVQRPVERSKGRFTPMGHMPSHCDGEEDVWCGGPKAGQPCPKPLWVIAEQ